jgi:DNA-binding transcriptional MocR family regulator
MAIDNQSVRRALGDWLLPGAGSVAGQLVVAFAHAIDAGLLPADAHLPPERELAAGLAVSRSTLRSAFEQLRARGLLDARQGSGTRVTGPAPRPDRPTYTGRSRMASAINLANAVPADAGAVAGCTTGIGVDDLLGCVPADGYAPAGLPSLRAACARYHTSRGLPTRPEQIVVTTGGQRGTLESLAALASAGDRVLVTPVTYPPVLDLLDHLGLVPVPVDCDADGPRAGELDRAVRRYRPACAFLMPAVGSPDGRATPPGAGRRTTSACASTGRGRSWTRRWPGSPTRGRPTRTAGADRAAHIGRCAMQRTPVPESFIRV